MARLALEGTREEVTAALIKRDGYACTFPGCEKPLGDPKDPDTFDHIYPQFRAKNDGWTREQIDAISNLQLQHKSCNVIKGHNLPDENGRFPMRQVKVPKAQRPDGCETCATGRLLLPGEVCYDCGGGPQPAMAPTATQKTPKECSHAGFDHCWMCYLDFVPRKSALQTLITGD